MKLPVLIEDMTFETYLGDPMPEPSLTSSAVKSLLATAPRKVWQKTKRLNHDAADENDAKFDLGTACHTLFTGKGDPIVIVDAKAFNTTAAKEVRDAAYAAGKTPILIGNMPRVNAMAKAALDQFSDNEDIGDLFKGSLREATVMWSEGGVMHRCRPDFYHPGTNTIIHYKTTGTEIAPGTLSKYGGNSAWHLTAAHYHAGFEILTGQAPRQFFAVQETTDPYLAIVAELDATFLETAMMRRRRAIEIWARCLRDNTWPGFPTKTVKLECPEWLERQMIAEKDAEEEARKAGRDLLDLARRWQAPEDYREPAAMSGRVVE